MNLDPKTVGVIVGAAIGAVGGLILAWGIVRAVREAKKPEVKVAEE